MLDAVGIRNAMSSTEIPASRQKDLLRMKAAASVEVLVYMHKVRKSGASRCECWDWVMSVANKQREGDFKVELARMRTKTLNYGLGED